MQQRNTVLSALLILTMAASATFAGEGLSRQDRSELIGRLEQTQQELASSVAGLSAAQWTFRAADDKWTIAQVVEHLVLSEGQIRGRVEELVSGEVAAPRPAARTEEVEGAILRFVRDRSQQFNAPSPIQPAGRFETAAAGLDAFRAERAISVDYVRTTDVDLRAYRSAFPPADLELDGAQWLLFMCGHVQRHLDQIEEVKRSPGYPAS